MCRTTPVPLGRAAGGRGSTPARPSTGSAATRRRRPPPARRCGARRPRCRRSSRGGPSAGQRSPPPRLPERAASPRGGVRSGPLGVEEGTRAAHSPLPLPGEPFHPKAVREDAPHEAAVVLVLRVPDGARVSGSSAFWWHKVSIKMQKVLHSTKQVPLAPKSTFRQKATKGNTLDGLGMMQMMCGLKWLHSS